MVGAGRIMGELVEGTAARHPAHVVAAVGTRAVGRAAAVTSTGTASATGAPPGRLEASLEYAPEEEAADNNQTDKPHCSINQSIKKLFPAHEYHIFNAESDNGHGQDVICA